MPLPGMLKEKEPSDSLPLFPVCKERFGRFMGSCETECLAQSHLDSNLHVPGCHPQSVPDKACRGLLEMCTAADRLSSQCFMSESRRCELELLSVLDIPRIQTGIPVSIPLSIQCGSALGPLSAHMRVCAQVCICAHTGMQTCTNTCRLTHLFT